MLNFDSRLASSASNSLAPRIYVVGSLNENPKSVLKVANFSYVIEDPKTAVDILFKIHLSMDLKFPRQSLSVWSFIDRFIYKQNLDISNSTQVLTIENEMNLFVSSRESST